MTTQAQGLITKTAGICGGSPAIAGTRVRVAVVVGYSRIYDNASRIREALPHLTIDQIEAALVYYAKHRDEIEEEIKQDEALIASHRWPKQRSI